jgi:hypothetical protein
MRVPRTTLAGMAILVVFLAVNFIQLQALRDMTFPFEPSGWRDV